MPPKLNFHLDPDQLAVIEAALSSPEAKQRAQAMLLLHQGQSLMDTAAALLVSQATVLRWHRAWRTSGVDGLASRAGRPQGGAVHYRVALVAALERNPRDVGIPSDAWTVTLLQAYLHQTLGVRMSETSLRVLLHRLGYRYQPDVTRLPLLQRTPRTRQEITEWLAEAAGLLPGLFGDKAAWKRREPEA
jgi:transposase